MSFRDLSAFLALKFYPTLMSSVGLASLCVFHAAVCAAAAAAAFFVLPETLGAALTRCATLTLRFRVSLDEEHVLMLLISPRKWTWTKTDHSTDLPLH